jgi:hypothetical protein
MAADRACAYNVCMTQKLMKALAEARRLTEQDQLDLAEFVQGFVAARTAEPHQLSPEEEAAINERLADIERGDIVSGEGAEALLRRPLG